MFPCNHDSIIVWVVLWENLVFPPSTRQVQVSLPWSDWTRTWWPKAWQKNSMDLTKKQQLFHFSIAKHVPRANTTALCDWLSPIGQHNRCQRKKEAETRMQVPGRRWVTSTERRETGIALCKTCTTIPTPLYLTLPRHTAPSHIQSPKKKRPCMMHTAWTIQKSVKVLCTRQLISQTNESERVKENEIHPALHVLKVLHMR